MLAMWLWTVLVLSESSCAMSLLLLPLARWLKISRSRSVRAPRIALAALSLIHYEHVRSNLPTRSRRALQLGSNGL